MKRVYSAFLIITATLLAGCAGNQNSLGIHTNSFRSSTASSTNSSSSKDMTKDMTNSAALKPTAVIYDVRNAGNKVALTFDDGPDRKYTPQILDILRKAHIHATFFLIGEHAEKYPDLVKRIVDEGHAIGNHTWDHPDLERLTNDQVKSEITKTDTVLKRLTGKSPKLFRAPYGAVSASVTSIAAETGHQVIGWSVDTMDWDGKNVAQILTAVRKEGKPGSIILQHSAGGKNGDLNNTVAALPQIIEYYQKKGYSFVTVPELLPDEHKQ